MKGKEIQSLNRHSELVTAVQHGEIERVQSLLELGLDPNYGEDGYTLLHWAVQEKFTDIIKLLIERGAAVDASYLRGITPLFSAAGDGDINVVRLLIELGANVNKSGPYGIPLHNAIAHRHTEVSELLIVKGADVNAIDEDGRTPLFNAAARGYVDLAHLLLANGARSDVQDNEGKRPIDVAKAKSKKTMTQLLS
ncbi:MAG: hypothetical protein JWN98_2459 [Abditibacteriota bacterium]|nr:hypothetical protein [Abditibacteriota bacterium]